MKPENVMANVFHLRWEGGKIFYGILSFDTIRSNTIYGMFEYVAYEL